MIYAPLKGVFRGCMQILLKIGYNMSCMRCQLLFWWMCHYWQEIIPIRLLATL